MLEQYLKQLLLDLELEPTVEKSRENFYSLKLPQISEIQLKKLDPGFYFKTTVGPTPEKRKEDFLGLLLRANYLGQGTRGASLGMSLDEKFLTLSASLSYEMNYKHFKESIEDFVNTTYYWQDELKLHNTIP